MSKVDKSKYTQALEKKEDTDEGEQGSSGGQGGDIEFRYVDPLTGPKRDDLLAPAEVKRLLHVHKDTHKMRVDSQKNLRKERAAVKEGRYVASMEAKIHQGYGLGGGSNQSSQFKSGHPLERTAQYSGLTERKVNGLPSNKDMVTNEETQQKLEERNELKLSNMPKFNRPPPRPKFPGG